MGRSFFFLFALPNGGTVVGSQLAAITSPSYNSFWNLLPVSSQAQRDDPELLSKCSLRNETSNPQIHSGWTSFSPTGLPRGVCPLSPFLIVKGENNTLFLGQLPILLKFSFGFFPFLRFCKVAVGWQWQWLFKFWRRCLVFLAALLECGSI